MNGMDNDPGFELASLPRERIGPFLILGVPKDADAETIESRWAQCVLWARQGKSRIPLGDIHWAREVLRDPERRLAADAASLNPDVAGQELHRLMKLYHLDTGKPGWAPLDPEPSALSTIDIPDPATVRDGVPAPDVPVEFPGVARWLDAFAKSPIDPWSIAAPLQASIVEAADE